MACVKIRVEKRNEIFYKNREKNYIFWNTFWVQRCASLLYIQLT